MSVNNIRLRLDQQTKSLEVPIMVQWDLNGVNDSIDIFEQNILNKIINPIDDFETTRYSHLPWENQINNKLETSISYEFYFYSSTTVNSITGETTATNWVTDYRANDITTRDVLFQNNVFKKSFFKLDFYDSKNSRSQQIYLTIIIPTRQSKTMSTIFGVSTVEIKKPVFALDFVGDKEGYFVYWLKDTEFVNLDTLYMTAKYYDAKTGLFKRMMTYPQGLLSNKFNFNNEDYFYYELNLDYNTYKYQMRLTNPLVTNQRVGTSQNPIKWYEYVNPPQQ